MNDNPENLSASYVIDRFEDDGWAVLERPDGETFSLPRVWLPYAAREGDVLNLRMHLPADDLTTDPTTSTLTFMVDQEATTARREKLESIRSKLKRGPAGDLEL